MLRERVATALVLLPVMLWVIAAGGWLYLLGVGATLSLAAIEFSALFRDYGHRPALPLIVVGVLGLTLARHILGFQESATALTLVILASMIWHMLDYEFGASKSGTDFAITLAGIMYLGWIGAYLVSLRRLPDGAWWVLLTLPVIWFADTGAYFAGKSLGRHKLAARLSPKKTWEGYLAGIAVGGLAGVALGGLWRFGAGPHSSITPMRCLVLGISVSTLAPFGDLGVSMIKRELGVKDSGSLLPGHGGVLDRIDSWIWAGVLSYYALSWMMG